MDELEKLLQLFMADPQMKKRARISSLQEDLRELQLDLFLPMSQNQESQK